ncbi:MAG: protein-export chaperone SecB [Geminicoccaceae bacterium]|nr:MAG: protein-export chaperone SecB [Geminicoccaceae bacterium]
MAENEIPGGAARPDAAADPQAQAPRLSIVAQYVKDLSFENPRAPMGMQANERPEIQIKVDSRGRQMEAERFEVELIINVEAKAGGEPLFVCELTYGGLFLIANVPQDAVQPVLMIECPRLLFPFARRVIADATRDGGFPPLMIDPIDFVALYRRRVAEAQAQAQAGAGNTPAGMPPAGNA